MPLARTTGVPMAGSFLVVAVSMEKLLIEGVFPPFAWVDVIHFKHVSCAEVQSTPRALVTLHVEQFRFDPAVQWVVLESACPVEEISVKR